MIRSGDARLDGVERDLPVTARHPGVAGAVRDGASDHASVRIIAEVAFARAVLLHEQFAGRDGLGRRLARPRLARRVAPLRLEPPGGGEQRRGGAVRRFVLREFFYRWPALLHNASDGGRVALRAQEEGALETRIERRILPLAVGGVLRRECFENFLRLHAPFQRGGLLAGDHHDLGLQTQRIGEPHPEPGTARIGLQERFEPRDLGAEARGRLGEVAGAFSNGAEIRVGVGQARLQLGRVVRIAHRDFFQRGPLAEKPVAGRGEVAAVEFEDGEIVVARHRLALPLRVFRIEAGERYAGVAIAHEPLAGRRKLALFVVHVADPILRLRPLEEQVAVAWVALDERRGAFERGGERRIRLGVAQLRDAHLADLREGLRLLRERGVGEVARVERLEVGHRIVAGGVERIEPVRLFQTSLQVVEHPGHQRLGFLLPALRIVTRDERQRR